MERLKLAHDVNPYSTQTLRSRLTSHPSRAVHLARGQKGWVDTLAQQCFKGIHITFVQVFTVEVF